MNAGAGKDTLTYNVSPGKDQVSIDGGAGTDALTINTLGQKSFTVLNAKGELIYQQGAGGTHIAVGNVECLKVLGPEGEVIYQSGC
jgi:hypothetical protein